MDEFLTDNFVTFLLFFHFTLQLCMTTADEWLGIGLNLGQTANTHSLRWTGKTNLRH